MKRSQHIRRKLFMFPGGINKTSMGLEPIFWDHAARIATENNKTLQDQLIAWFEEKPGERDRSSFVREKIVLDLTQARN